LVETPEKFQDHLLQINPTNSLNKKPIINRSQKSFSFKNFLLTNQDAHEGKKIREESSKTIVENKKKNILPSQSKSVNGTQSIKKYKHSCLYFSN
jgi:hypothetical protein